MTWRAKWIVSLSYIFHYTRQSLCQKYEKPKIINTFLPRFGSTRRSHESVEISVRVPSVVLQQARVCTIPNSNVQRLIVGAQGYTGNLAKYVDFLAFLEVSLGAVDVNKIRGFSHHQELPVWREAERSHCAYVSFEHRYRLRQVSHVPDPACFVLISRCEGAPVRVPCGRERVVSMTNDWRNSLKTKFLRLLQPFDCTLESYKDRIETI